MPGDENMRGGGSTRGSGGGGTRGRGGRARSVRTRGGSQQRPQAVDDVNLGMLNELPAGRPLEQPIHAKRRRQLVYQDYGGQGIWVVDAPPRDSGESSNTPPDPILPTTPTTHPELIPCELEQPPSTSMESNIPSPFNPCEVAQPTSPAVYMECTALYTPRSNPHLNRRCCLRDDDIVDLLGYGSEEDDDQEDGEAEGEPPVPVPRSLRLFLEPAEDSNSETEAAGRIADGSPAILLEEEESHNHEPADLFNFIWRNFPIPAIEPELRRETFVGNSGPTIEISTSPYDIFTRIWDRSIVEHIVAETNRYAQEYAAGLLNAGLMHPNSRIMKWVDTDVDEIYCYLALVMSMGIIVKSDIESYWNQEDDVFCTPGFSKIMSLRRFQILSKCLHFNANENITSLAPSQAKIHKIIPIVDHLNRKFGELFNLGHNIALDESLTQWKGWLQIKQFIPNKNAAVGVKTYEVCDSHTGYLWKFIVHTGDVSVEDNYSVISGSIPNLVLRLLRGLEHTGRTVWMDNYYNSPALARVLKTRGLDCVGTLRTNRQFVPQQIVDLTKGNMRVGQVCGCTSGDVDLMVWRDQNRVAMISTYHGVAVSDDKPTIVRDYNVCMGGVDKKDQMIAMFPLERKRTKIWYKKFFRRLLNVSILNAYIIHKHFHRRVQHREFRVQLVKELLAKHQVSRSRPLQLNTSAAPSSKLPTSMLDHLPVELPPLPNSVGKQRRFCRVCKKRTSQYCKACNAALCFGPKSTCYRQFHS